MKTKTSNKELYRISKPFPSINYGSKFFFFFYIYKMFTLRAESPSIFLEKSEGRRLFPLPDFSREIEGDSARRVQDVLSDIFLLQGHERLQLHTRNQTMLYSWNSWKTPGFLKKKIQVPGKLIEISNLASTPGKFPEFIY